MAAALCSRFFKVLFLFGEVRPVGRGLLSNDPLRALDLGRGGGQLDFQLAALLLELVDPLLARGSQLPNPTKAQETK